MDELFERPRKMCENQPIEDHPHLGKLLFADTYVSHGLLFDTKQAVGIHELGVSICHGKTTAPIFFNELVNSSTAKVFHSFNHADSGLSYEFELSFESGSVEILLFRRGPLKKKERRRFFGLSFLPEITHSYWVNPESDMLLGILGVVFRAAVETHDFRLNRDFALEMRQRY